MVDGVKCKATHEEELLEDAEGSSRHNNLCFLGFPEREKGPAADLFLESWITTELRPMGLSNIFSIERVHQALAPVLCPGAPPRALIARFLICRGSDFILQHVHVHGPPLYGDKAIQIFPDYTRKVQEIISGC